MKEVYTLTEAKAKLSEIVNRLLYERTRVQITRKGKKVAVILPFDDYVDLKKGKTGGLIHAQKVLAEIDQDIEAMCEDIYKAREREKPRRVEI